MKKIFQAYYVHCSAHQAYLVLKQVLSCTTEALILFANFSGFTTFSVSQKYSDLFSKPELN